jgi:hypothetical protein
MVPSQQRAVLLAQGMQRLASAHSFFAKPIVEPIKNWVATVILLRLVRKRRPFTLDHEYALSGHIAFLEDIHHFRVNGNIRD